MLANLSGLKRLYVNRNIDYHTKLSLGYMVGPIGRDLNDDNHLTLVPSSRQFKVNES